MSSTSSNACDMARPQWMACMDVIKFYVIKNQMEWTRVRGSRFWVDVCKEKNCQLSVLLHGVVTTRSKIFQTSAQWPASGIWGDLHSVWEAVPTGSCSAFQFYEPSVSYTIRFYYGWVFEMKTCSRRKTVSFFCENVTTTTTACSLVVWSVACVSSQGSLLRRSRPLLLWCAAIWTVGVCREHSVDSYAIPCWQL